MRYFKLTIAYDGTDFHGWQFQPGKPTIQGEVVGILRKLTQENVQLAGTGRTDAGVHALGQVASFKTQSSIVGRPISACAELHAAAYDSHRWMRKRSGRISARVFRLLGKVYRYRIYRGRVVAADALALRVALSVAAR